MAVVDASIVVRLLQNRRDDTALRAWFAGQRRVRAPTLIDAEVASAIRGLMMATKPTVGVTPERGLEMAQDFADLPLDRYPMHPHLTRVLTLRNNFTAYDAFYVALAEALDVPLVTDDHKFAKAPGHNAHVQRWE